MKNLILFLTLSVISAHAADSTGTVDAHRQRIDAAVAARDYDAWKAEHDAFSQGKGGMKVTRENFETYAKMREAQAAGRTDEAQALRSQLGMGQGSQGKGQGMKGCRKAAGAPCTKGQGGSAVKGNGNGHKGQGCQRVQ